MKKKLNDLDYIVKYHGSILLPPPLARIAGIAGSDSIIS